MNARVRARLASLVVLTGIGAGAGLAAAAAQQAAILKVAQNAQLGSIVVGSTGLTLYHLTSEKKGTVACTGPCAVQWPPLVVAAGVTPVAGPGLAAAKLGTIKRPDGKLQVTYGGYPLYRFAGDTKSGQANGQGVESTWFALTPAGKVTKAGATPGSTTPAGTTPTGTTPTTTPASTPTAPGDGNLGY